MPLSSGGLGRGKPAWVQSPSPSREAKQSWCSSSEPALSPRGSHSSAKQMLPTTWIPTCCSLQGTGCFMKGAVPTQSRTGLPAMPCGPLSEARPLDWQAPPTGRRARPFAWLRFCFLALQRGTPVMSTSLPP